MALSTHVAPGPLAQPWSLGRKQVGSSHWGSGGWNPLNGPVRETDISMSLIAGQGGGARCGPSPTSQLESPIQETVLLVQLELLPS